MNKTVTVVGNALIDIIFGVPKHFLLRHGTKQSIELPFGSKLEASDYAICVGGSGANVAIGLSKLGYKVTLRTALSTDRLAEFIRENIQSTGVVVVDTAVAKQTAVSTILRLEGDRTIITGTTGELSYPLTDMAETGWIHLGPLSPQSDQLLQDITSHRLKTGQGLSMNPSMAQIELRGRLFQSSLKLLDVIFLNHAEASRLARTSDRADILATIRTIHSFGVKVVCVTDGERGAIVSDNQRVLKAEAVCDRQRLVDATGAGDGFASAFLATYISSAEETEEQILERSLESAILNSGSVVGGIGAQETLLNPREIEQDQGKVKIKILR